METSDLIHRSRIDRAPTTEKNLTIVEHLEELRWRIIRCLIAVGVASCISYSRALEILAFVSRPAGRLVFLAPQEAFMAVMYIALFSGLVISSPYLIYQLWGFLSSGLHEREKRWLLVFGPLSYLLFIVGGVFGYCVIAPIGLRFLLGFATDTLVPMISVTRYLSFVGTMTLSFGIAFEVPVVILFLAKIGVVSVSFLVAKRRHAIVIAFIIGAVLTPPDVVSQFLLAVPLVALFELSVVLTRLVCKEKAG